MAFRITRAESGHERKYFFTTDALILVDPYYGENRHEHYMWVNL